MTTKRGFATLDPAVMKDIARKGGVASQKTGTAHNWTSSEARIYGAKGGKISRGGGHKVNPLIQTMRDIVNDSSNPGELTILRERIELLPVKERTVIRKRIGLECQILTQEQIGQQFEVTRARVAQIEASALKKLAALAA